MIDMGNNRNVANIITSFQSFFFLSNDMLGKTLRKTAAGIFITAGKHRKLFSWHGIQKL